RLVLPSHGAYSSRRPSRSGHEGRPDLRHAHADALCLMACNRLIAPDDPRLKVARDGVEPPTPAPRLARRRPARRRRDTGAIRTTTPTAIRPRDDVVVRVQGD